MRRVYLIAAVATALATTSFTAQEPPLAPVDRAPPSPISLPSTPNVAYGQIDAPIRLEFRAGKDNADHRILWQHDGVQVEAVRFSIGSGPDPMEVVALAEGMQVQGRAFTTVCKSIEIRPVQLGVDPRSVPSSKSSGHFSISRSAPGRAMLTFGSFRVECTKLVVAGDRNRLEMTPGPQFMQVKTKDAEFRAVSVGVNYELGFRLSLSATTPPERGDAEGEKIHLQEPR